MTICPICEQDYKNLPNHMRHSHPDVFVQEKEQIKEKSTQKINTSKSSALDRMKIRLEKQNEIYMLMFEQQQISKALQTGVMPTSEPQPTQNVGAIKDALELIKSLKEDFPNEAQEPTDPLLEIGQTLLMNHLANKQTPIPPTPPSPPIDLELPDAPEPDYEGVKEDDDRSVEDKGSSEVAGSVLPEANPDKQQPNKDTKGTKET